MTFQGLSKDILRTFSGLSKEFLRTVSVLSQDFLRSFSGNSEFGTDCLGLVSVVNQKESCKSYDYVKWCVAHVWILLSAGASKGRVFYQQGFPV